MITCKGPQWDRSQTIFSSTVYFHSLLYQSQLNSVADMSQHVTFSQEFMVSLRWFPSLHQARTILWSPVLTSELVYSCVVWMCSLCSVEVWCIILFSSLISDTESDSIDWGVRWYFASCTGYEWQTKLALAIMVEPETSQSCFVSVARKVACLHFAHESYHCQVLSVINAVEKTNNWLLKVEGGSLKTHSAQSLSTKNCCALVKFSRICLFKKIHYYPWHLLHCFHLCIL